ncbi:hypothetical protein [Acetobacter fallax]|uniref:Uncharacterized protein n=1 Tax=Acetobacter fallax TaxID=1737473 RepID=A0ABX0KIP2_9PROT|nr:hypothetical protein [Acetobacter fallax]NHO33767.1 hypothetical protein [Acetobacter fallax]NHO37328.1 hypothetical protein [Acetobacter fallax]
MNPVSFFAAALCAAQLVPEARAQVMPLDLPATESHFTTYTGHCTGSYGCRTLSVDTHDDSLSIDMTDLIRDGSHAILAGVKIADPEGGDREVYRLTTLTSQFRHADFKAGKFQADSVPDSTCIIHRPMHDAALSSLSCTYYTVNEFGDADPTIFGFVRSP